MRYRQLKSAAPPATAPRGLARALPALVLLAAGGLLGLAACSGGAEADYPPRRQRCRSRGATAWRASARVPASPAPPALPSPSTLLGSLALSGAGKQPSTAPEMRLRRGADYSLALPPAQVSVDGALAHFTPAWTHAAARPGRPGLRAVRLQPAAGRRLRRR